MNRIATLALTAAMVGTMTLTASATEVNLDTTTFNDPNVGNYQHIITINGFTLDARSLPASEGIPMRLVTEADHGFADWYESEGSSVFYLDNNMIHVTFATGEVLVNNEAVDTNLELISGVTYLPASVISAMEGYTVETIEEDGFIFIDITTPNGAPLMQAAYDIMDATEMGIGMKAGAEDLEMFGMDAANFADFAAFFPMMTNPDTVVVAQLTEDADVDALTAQWDTYCATQAETFSWYLSHNLPRVEDARMEIAGDYVLFLIAENADAGVEAFHATVDALSN